MLTEFAVPLVIAIPEDCKIHLPINYSLHIKLFASYAHIQAKYENHKLISPIVPWYRGTVVPWYRGTNH